jgi:hypothetical protein
MFAVPLCQPDGLAGSLAKVIKFCSPCLSAPDGPDIDYVGRVQWEDSLDALVIDDTPDSETLVYPPALAADYRAGKDLRAFLVALGYAAVNIDYITYLEVRDIFF